MAIDLKLYKKYHRFQEESGWCGPAVVQILLRFINKNKTQKEIAKDIYKSWWGTGNSILFAYLSKFFKKYNYKTDSTLEDIKSHLDKNHLIIVNWWDDISSDEEADGHYSLVAGYDEEKRLLTLCDPSNERKGIWQIDFDEFNNSWFDYLDTRRLILVKGYLLWLDPFSAKARIRT